MSAEAARPSDKTARPHGVAGYGSTDRPQLPPTAAAGADVAIPLLNADPAASPAPSWHARVITRISSWSPRRKILTAAIAVGTVAAIATTVAVVLTRRSGQSEGPPEPGHPPHNATEICKQVPDVGAAYLSSLFTPVVEGITSNITRIVTQLCSGPHITDPTVISAAQTALASLRNDLANQTTSVITGCFYNPQNPYTCNGIPSSAYELIYHSLVDSECSGLVRQCTKWQGLEGFYIPVWVGSYPSSINLQEMREAAFVALLKLCENMVVAPAFFSGNYSCGPVAGIASPIKNLATAQYVWPANVTAS